MTGTPLVVNRRARQHFDLPLVIIAYLLAIFGVFAITVATYKYTGETVAVDTPACRATSMMVAAKYIIPFLKITLNNILS